MSDNNVQDSNTALRELVLGAALIVCSEFAPEHKLGKMAQIFALGYLAALASNNPNISEAAMTAMFELLRVFIDEASGPDNGFGGGNNRPNFGA